MPLFNQLFIQNENQRPTQQFRQICPSKGTSDTMIAMTIFVDIEGPGNHQELADIMCNFKHKVIDKIIDDGK